MHSWNTYWRICSDITASVCCFLRISRDGENSASLERKVCSRLNRGSFPDPYFEIKLRKGAAGTPPLVTLVTTQHCSLTWKQLKKHVGLEMVILYSSDILDLILVANFSDHTGIEKQNISGFVYGLVSLHVTRFFLHTIWLENSKLTRDWSF